MTDPYANRSEDATVVERILRHVDARTTDTGTDVWREPVANYRSADRFQAELASVLRRCAVPFCPSAALPDPGSYLARTAAGVPLLAVRGRDGTVRAFRNACRHRGAALADGAGCTRSFVCPYHAWTYGLDGGLVHVPHEDGFPGLDKVTHGLVPVRCEERSGLVWVTQDEALPGAPDPLPEMFTPGAELFATRQVEHDVNWKVLLESFIEGYHIRYAHPETFYPYGYDNLNLIDFYGRSSRITYPFRRIEKLRPVPPEQRRVDGKLTFVYHLFPNVLVTMLSRHTSLVVLEPLAADRTRQITWSIARGVGEEALAEARRDAQFVGDTGVAEDLAVVHAIQRSLASGANEVFTFGHYESAIVHFHRMLDAALGSIRHSQW